METEFPPPTPLKTRREIREAFETIVSTYQTPLLSFLARYLADASAAADVAQEAFVRAYFRLDHFDDRRPFGPWLFTIAGNLARDYLRRHQRREARLQAYEPPEAPAFADAESGEAAALDRAIAALPDGLREPIVLHYQMDWPLAEIAQHLGVQEGAVKTRLHRARRQLREMIQEEYS